MLSRKFVQNCSRNLARNFAGNHTYIQEPGSGTGKDVTLIPGSFIGPEITSKYFIFSKIKDI